MAEAKYSGLPADSQVTRRNLLRAAPAAGLAAMMAGAAPAEADPETAVQAKFRIWQDLKAQWDVAVEGNLPDEANNAWCVRVFAAADAVLDAPSTGPGDFVLKLFAQTFDGEHEIGDCPRANEIWAEARSLIGEAA